jgi:xanthine dehydrogenase accessory factor
VNGISIVSPFDGTLRGLIHPKVELTEGMKIGDLDARDDSSMVRFVSDKALSVAGGVLEAVFVKLREME